MPESRAILRADTRLSVSIVVYQPDCQELQETLTSLQAAHAVLCDGASELIVIDNGGAAALTLDAVCRDGLNASLLTGHGNIGYGRGHNLAIERVASDYHLILNPDVTMDADALQRALEFLEQHPRVGLLTPYIADREGHQQFLCRRYPTALDLFVRGFLPARLRQCFARRLARYEMRDVINDHDVLMDPPIVSGCFMLFRTSVLKQLGGFDPRYFLYFEDYDLSLRTHELAQVAYVPSVRIRHFGGGAGRKGWRHIRMFGASAFKFYRRFGWKLF
jgi:GT2 family glycosyltransferase